VKEGLSFVEDATTKTQKTSTALTERVSERGGERGSFNINLPGRTD